MSVWGSTDTLGLTGDQEMDFPSDATSAPPPATTFPGGFPTAAADPFASGVPGIGGGPDLNLASSGPSSSGGGILALLSSLFSNNSASGAAAGLGGGTTGGITSGLAGLLGPIMSLFSGGKGENGGGASGGLEGGLSGAVQGGISGGEIGGPYGAIAGALIEGLLGGLSGAGVTGSLPREAKPEALVGTLDASGNPIEAELGKYIQTSGINQGFDLSESGAKPFNPTREADVLQLLGGTALPNSVTATGFNNNPTLKGWKNLTQLQQMDPNATELNGNQLDQIKGLIAHLVNKSGGQSLQKLLGEESGLAAKLKAAETY